MPDESLNKKITELLEDFKFKKTLHETESYDLSSSCVLSSRKAGIYKEIIEKINRKNPNQISADFIADEIEDITTKMSDLKDKISNKKNVYEQSLLDIYDEIKKKLRVLI